MENLRCLQAHLALDEASTQRQADELRALEVVVDLIAAKVHAQKSAERSSAAFNSETVEGSPAERHDASNSEQIGRIS